jgi:hypothetical protein
MPFILRGLLNNKITVLRWVNTVVKYLFSYFLFNYWEKMGCSSKFDKRFGLMGIQARIFCLASRNRR